MGNSRQIAERLLQAGLSLQTPVSFIEQGTTTRQRTLSSELAAAAAAAEAANVSPPATIVVGQVAQFGKDLAWFEQLPLFGKNILVTRPKHQAQQLCRLLRELGAHPLETPTVRIAPPRSFSQLDGELCRASEFDWLVFTSAYGVAAVLERLPDLGLDIRALAGPKIAAIGPPTSAALQRLNLKVDLVPLTFTTAALAEELIGQGITGTSVLIPRSAQAPDGLVSRLEEAGAKVTATAAYQTISEASHAGEIRQLVQAGRLDAITFTSSSCVRGFASALGDSDLPAALQDTVVACIGPVTAESVRELGLNATTIAENATAAGLVDALVRVFEPTASVARRAAS